MEEWKPIATLDGIYEASTQGRIRNTKTHHIKAQVFDGHYYKFGYDYKFNGEHKTGWYRVHKAIAETFLDNPENKPTVNHKDGNTANNSIDNLEWATFKEQMQHASKQLKRNCGENKKGALFNNEQVKTMRQMHEKQGMTAKEIAKLFNTKTRYITKILHYKIYVNI